MITKRKIALGAIASAAVLMPLGGIAAASATTAPEEVASSPVTSLPTTSPTAPSSVEGATSASSAAASPGTPTESGSPRPVESPAASSLPIVTAPATSPAHPSSPNNTTALFVINGHDWTKPQTFVTSVPRADLHAFDDVLKCGTDYQIDIYDDEHGDPSVLWRDGFLYYATDGKYLDYDLGYTPYKTLTTPECEETPSSPPTTTPPTDHPSTPPSDEPTDEPSVPTDEPTAPAPTPSSPSSTPNGTPTTSVVNVPSSGPSAGTIVRSDGRTDSSLAFTGASESTGWWVLGGLGTLAAGITAFVLGRRKFRTQH